MTSKIYKEKKYKPMDKVTDLLDSFLYELSSYVIPGALFNMLAKYSINVINNDKGIVKLSDINILIVFKDFGALEWILFFILAYMMGMLIAGFVFFLHGKRGFLRCFESEYGFYRILREKKSHNHFEEHKIKLRDTIENKFDLIIGDDKMLIKKFDLIGTLIIRYVEEKSLASRPCARYYPRICLFSNIAYVILFFSILSLFIFQRMILSHVFILTIGGVSLYFILMQYVSLQIVWRAQYILRRFYVIN